LIGSNLIKTHSPDRVLVVTGDHVKQKNPAGVKVLQVPLAPERRFVIGPLLETLRREKLTSVMVEGGASTFGAFFDSGYVNRVHVFLAPVLMGGKHGLGWSEYFGGQSMRDKIQLDRSVIERVGNDVYWTARVRWP
jgi:diaminohydroxyphosphoribosylaminopyrimidine deaminase/5-amino-6-(5-phosphoribosylamino)uracil reductase